MVMQSKTALCVAAASAGVAFIGYCVYFDHKRRNDPDFKNKLREKRRKARESQQSYASNTPLSLPDFRDPESMQKFFLEEVTKGEELLAAGQIEDGVEHLSNAVAVCGQPQQLLQVLQQTLPPQVFQLLIQKLPGTTQRLTSAASSGVGFGIGATESQQTITELDLE